VTADKIYLVGFMACGKSMLARALGSRLDWRVEDIDDLIEVRERQTIADIFAKHGEPYFRQVERDMLRLVRLDRRSLHRASVSDKISSQASRLRKIVIRRIRKCFVRQHQAKIPVAPALPIQLQVIHLAGARMEGLPIVPDGLHRHQIRQR
jgi:dephospho-CoA kinase